MKKIRNAGFSLVELIVVIAIMAILVGVAVPVYTSYIEKAQKSKDIQLVDEVVHTLQIAAVSELWSDKMPNGGSIGAVVLTTDGLTISGDKDGLIANALTEIYGSDYPTTLKLSYEDWNVEYQSSSFSGNESALLSKVDTLTDILGAVIKDNQDLVGEDFSNYLSILGIDSANPDNQEAIANAAVLYVANKSANMSEDSQQEFITYINNLPSSGKTSASEIATDLVGIFDGSYVTAAAALYATAEGYCQYEKSMGNDKPLTILDEATKNIDTSNISADNKLAAVEEVFNAFAAVQKEVLIDNPDQYNFNKYFDSVAEANSKAYFDILSTVNSVENELVDSLYIENCFSSQTISDLLASYADGGIIITVAVNSDGTTNIVNPLN